MGKVSSYTDTTPLDADMFYFAKSGTPNTSKMSTWTRIKSTLKTYFDTLYTPPYLFPNKVIGGVVHNQLWVGGFKPTITSGCAASAQIEMGTNKNVYDYLAFDASTIEYAYANIVMPADYTGGVIYFKPYWLHPATTINFNVSWGLAGVSFSNDDTLDAAQGTAIYSNDTGGTTSDLYIGDLSAAVTIAGTPVANDLVQFRCLRKADDGTNDTLAVDAYLLGFMIYYPVA